MLILRLLCSIIMARIDDVQVELARVRREAMRAEATRAALEQSEARYRFLVEALPHVVWSRWPDGSVDYCNQVWTDYSGLTLEESIGRGWMVALHPDDEQTVVERWQQAYINKEPYEMDVRLRRAADGAYRWHRVKWSPVRAVDRHLIKWIGAALDIEEQKRAEQQQMLMQRSLLENAKRFKALVENASDAICLLSAEGRVLYASPAMERLVGYESDEILGRGIFKAIHLDDVDEAQRKFAELCMKPYSSMKFVVRVQRKRSSTWHWLEIIATNLLHEPDVCALVADCRDITERQHAEEEWQRLIRELETRLAELSRQINSHHHTGTEKQEESERTIVVNERGDRTNRSFAALMLGLKAMMAEPPVSVSSLNNAEVYPSHAEDTLGQPNHVRVKSRPKTPEDVGFAAALSNYVTQWSEESKIPADFYNGGMNEQERLPPNIEDALYVIVQEALTNVAAHAEASRARVTLERLGNRVLVVVEDNGHGFDPATLMRQSALVIDSGLQNMQQTATNIGGILHVESAPEHGTSVFVRVPV